MWGTWEDSQGWGKVPRKSAEEETHSEINLTKMKWHIEHGVETGVNEVQGDTTYGKREDFINSEMHCEC